MNPKTINPFTSCLFLLQLFLLCKLCTSQTKQSCHSPIYCQGDLLHVVQTAKIFNDSKTFVDMALIHPVNETLAEFYKMMAENDDKPTREKIQEFVHNHFVSIGELEEYYPRDFKAEPKIVKEIDEPVIRDFTKSLIALWPTLTRKVSYHVLEQPDTHSLIPVEHPFVIPGGRFREYYYWDSYWIIKGLLLSEMYETARGMVQNILSMVERYGFVPNGGRIYYLNRSQPPLLTLMVADYVKWTNDFEFVRFNIKTLVRELTWWLNKRSTTIVRNGHSYILCHYDSSSDTPRPESYMEDLQACSLRKTEDERYECYTDLKAGAETGWDFTVRWFYDKQGNPATEMHHIHTRRTIPADLNAFLYKCFREMYKFFTILRQPDDAKYWLDMSDQWKHSMKMVLFNEEDGVWYDYDMKLGKQRKFFFASNLVPLWAGAFDESERQARGKSAVDHLSKYGILQFKGGIPMSTVASGQQWDYPNAWAPYQNLLIIGLHKSGHPEAVAVARDFAHAWVNSNIKAFHENKVMFEKYDAKNSGQFGGGGEYVIQAGFGWSNGCVLELINFYFRTKTRKWKN